MSQFTTLGLSSVVLRALADEGYETPTPIQAQTIAPALQGRDILGCAQTGTGKTAAFALPIIHRLLEQKAATPPQRGPVLPRALVLSPTRELATQIAESFATYGRHAGLRGAVIYGGVSQMRQEKALARGVDIIVATPGRLIDLMEQGIMDFSRITTLVLDEADRMLDMGFIQPIRRISAAVPAPRQTMLFSATMPKEILGLANSLLKDPVRVTVTPVSSAVPLIEQSVYMVPRVSKAVLLEHLLREREVGRAVVFTRTKHGAEKLSKHLNKTGVASDAIHGNKSQNQRERALDGFRRGKSRVLVATDVAARGLDVDGITHVFNFDLPNEPEAYVHRIGRTGRAGASGVAISFCDHEERDFLRAIERLTGKKIDTTPTPNNLPKPERMVATIDSPAHPHRTPHRGAGQRPGHAPAPPSARPSTRPPERPPERSSLAEPSRDRGVYRSSRPGDGAGRGGSPAPSHGTGSGVPRGPVPFGLRGRSPSKRPGVGSRGRS